MREVLLRRLSQYEIDKLVAELLKEEELVEELESQG